MNANLFRKTSIDRVNSPEQLNDYIKVANPGVWLILSAIVCLLLGVVIWSAFGTIETTVDTAVMVKGNTATCYVSEEDASRLEPGMAVTVEGQTGFVKVVSSTPVQVDATFDAYLLHLTGFAEGDFCYAAEIELSGVADGAHTAVITVDSVHPISFVIH